jgi:hypothetical protein
VKELVVVVVKSMRSSGRARPRARRWASALVVAAIAVLASGCIMDVNAEQGEDAVFRALNDDGALAGTYLDKQSHWHLARFEPDKTRVELQNPHGWDPYLLDINDAREVLARVVITNPAGRREEFPVVWDPSGALIDLRPYIPGHGRPGVATMASGLTEEGLVIGNLWGVDETTSPPTPVASVFVVDVRNRRSLPVPDPFPGGVPLIADINDHGVIVGTGLGGPDGIWTPHEGSYDYQALPDRFRVDGINNAGDLVGLDVTTLQPTVRRAGAPDFAALPGGAGRRPVDGPLLINDAGMVISPARDETGQRRPTRWATFDAQPEWFPNDSWREPVLWDLNNAGATLLSATRTDGHTRALRWTVG